VPRLYPREFRDDVVRVARDRDGGVTIEQIAGDFGVHPMTLPPWDATRRWPVTCRRGHRGVQTRGAGAADNGIEDERHARLRALSRSVGTADGVPGHGSVSVACQLCCQSRRELARISAPAAHCRCLQLRSQTTGSDHHADRRTQHGPRRAPRAA
jgi:transposase-like protein